MRADALKSILVNFGTLQETWEDAVVVVKDSETKARIRGVSVMMSTFNYLFGNVLGEMLLKHTDNLSKTLQDKAAEGQQIAKMTVLTIKSLQNDEAFDNFWLKLNHTASSLQIGEPRLPRKRKAPCRLDDGSSAGDFHDNPKSLYRGSITMKQSIC